MVFSAWQRGFLEQCRVGRLGTIAADGRPHVVPICYALNGPQIVVAIDEKPKRRARLARLQNIERDPRVALLVDEYSEDWERLAWLRVDGVARVLGRGAERPAALLALRGRYPQYRLMNLEDLPLIEIDPERAMEWRWHAEDD